MTLNVHLLLKITETQDWKMQSFSMTAKLSISNTDQYLDFTQKGLTPTDHKI